MLVSKPISKYLNNSLLVNCFSRNCFSVSNLRKEFLLSKSKSKYSLNRFLALGRVFIEDPASQ